MDNKSARKLIFIYNADSGVLNMILDGAHKIFSPSTYGCNLYDITYGAFVESLIWKKFRYETNIKMEFLHKDEFAKTYKSKFGHNYTFPIILKPTVNGLEVFIKTVELNILKNTNELIELIDERE